MDDSISFSIILGVFSGVLTAFLLQVVVSIFRTVLLPWYRGFIYKGIDLSGEWAWVKKVEDRENKIHLFLSQKANQLSGHCTYYSIKNDRIKEIHYKFTGSIREGYLMINMNNIDKRFIAYATCLLKIEDAGRTLNGIHAWRNSGKDLVDSAEVCYKRKDDSGDVTK